MTDVYWTPDLSKPLSHAFTYDVGDHGWGNEELQNYTDRRANAFIEGDAIVIRAIAAAAEEEEVAANGQRSSFTSARLVSKQCLDADRGYVEAEIITPHAKGIWYAFWLLPRKPFEWPSDGEVDIAEGWDAKRENGNCLHWGHFNERDANKHRVLYHPVDDATKNTYGFCWSARGLIWFFNGKPTMRAEPPPGIRPLAHFHVILNIAMGGNVMNGSTPNVPSSHDMVVRNLKFCRNPPGGWQAFDAAWQHAREGNTM